FMQGWKGGQVAIGVDGWLFRQGWMGGYRGGRVDGWLQGWTGGLSCGAYLNKDVPLFPRS
ncbi:MAG: hypothetical protein VX367_09295, partial [SAR324 cluster bacterium]|nr:hypothetical protein [SAR324 cluster bacterium]